MSLDAMKQALAVLEEIADEVFSPYDNKIGDAILALRAAIEQAQEPVAWKWKERVNDEFDSWVVTASEPPPYAIETHPLFTAPRQWQGLTDEEIKEIIGPWGEKPIKGYTRKLFDQIEATLKEKNG